LGWGTGAQGMYQNDFLGLTFKNSVVNGKPTGPPLTGLYIVQNLYEIETSRSKWVDLAVVFGMVLGYRIMFFLMIKFKEDVKPMLYSLLSRCTNPSCSTTGHRRWSNKSKRLLLQSPVAPSTANPSPLNDAVPLQRFM
jgi:hypothetical protein